MLARVWLGGSDTATCSLAFVASSRVLTRSPAPSVWVTGFSDYWLFPDVHKRSFTQRYSHWWECPQFELQQAIAIAFRGATGLRNKAHRDFQGTILELKRRAAVA